MGHGLHAEADSAAFAEALDGVAQQLRLAGRTRTPAGPDFEIAARAAQACGVTRLADLTDLDRLGVPVFHSVRPRSRSLSVHQGKGLTARDARLGALMEAVESARAEVFDDTCRTAAFEDLPLETRPVRLDDFARDRRDPVGRDEPIAWAQAHRILDGRPVLVPADCVSLDCIGPWDWRLQHTSNGLGARFESEGAILKGLLEVLERDALAAWERLPLMPRALRAVACGSIGYPWFIDLLARIAAAELSMLLFALPNVLRLPCLHAQLVARDPAPGQSVIAIGAACALTPEEALRSAALEAVQSRLTGIAAARDDILYGRGRGSPLGVGLQPPGARRLDWAAFCDGAAAEPDASPRRLAERLAAEGYPDACWRPVGPPSHGVHVVKVFVPGLATLTCARRPPVAAEGRA